MKIFIVVNGRVCYRHVAYICLLPVGFFSYFSKIFPVNFLPHWKEHLCLLKLLAWGIFRQNSLLHKVTEGWSLLGGGGIEEVKYSWSENYYCLSTSSFIYHEEYLRSCLLQEMLVMMKFLNRRLLYVVAVMNPLFKQLGQCTWKHRPGQN